VVVPIQCLRMASSGSIDFFLGGHVSAMARRIFISGPVFGNCRTGRCGRFSSRRRLVLIGGNQASEADSQNVQTDSFCFM